jgi:hypothetical protein
MMMGVIYNDDESDDGLCACFRVVHFRGSLTLICELCDYVTMCICVKLVEFNYLRSYRV